VQAKTSGEGVVDVEGSGFIVQCVITDFKMMGIGGEVEVGEGGEEACV
jgi:hypothetical protein